MIERRPIDRLILVYDADSGTLAAVFDSAKKLLRLGGCPLCTITHGLAGERDEWRECRQELGVPIDTVHRDEIGPELDAVLGGELPAVVAEAGDELVLVMGREDLERSKSSVADFRGRLLYFAGRHGLSLPATSAMGEMKAAG
jgi:hypothetical protein